MNVTLMTRLLKVALCAWVSFHGSAAGADADPPQAVPKDAGWPRQYNGDGGKLILYQPQVDEWKEFRRLKGRFAVAIIPSTSKKTVYGAIRVEGVTDVDMASRTVGLTDFKVVEARFPAVYAEPDQKNFEALTIKLFPSNTTTIALDRVLAYMDSTQVKARETNVSLEPPPILVSNQPAVLVIIDGEPAFYDVENTSLRKVVNTNWDLFFDKKTTRYYLRNQKTWWSAKELDDAWREEKKLPDSFAKLPASEEYKEVKETAAAPEKAPTVTLVLVVKKPTELVVINGAPSLAPIPGVQLQWVANTECDLFFLDGYYYLLTSGRWFRTAQLNGGQWEAATTKLPPDFRQIPLNHPRAHVLASVPGTKQAEEAVLLASIPVTATVDRKTTQAKVQYVGEPSFKTIDGTKLSYAENTPNDVLRVGDTYYLCLDGVWFKSASATGPWDLTDKVPDEIYGIPAQSSKHHVTYVTVQDSTPDTVVYGYTPGYTGVYVSFGVAMWGTGYYYPPYYGWGYYPYPVYWPAAYYTYGASAWYNPVTGAYARGSAVYGPYGGYGRAAAYNPSTGRYAWGHAAYGPYGAAASGGFYNPNTGTWGSRAVASNGYQTWGSSVINRGNQTAVTRSYADSRGAVGAARTSAGGGAIAARGYQGQGQGFIARSAAGDVYAGRDGNVYKRDQSGSWYKNSGSGSWDSVNRPSAAQGRVGTETVQGLHRDATARSAGTYNTQRSAASTSGYGNRSGAYGGSGSYSRGSYSRGSYSGGGFRGGGRRR